MWRDKYSLRSDVYIGKDEHTCYAISVPRHVNHAIKGAGRKKKNFKLRYIKGIRENVTSQLLMKPRAT